MDPLQGNEMIRQFIKLLEENNRQGQASDLSQLMWYMDGMTRQYEAVLNELQEVRQQLAQEREPAVKYVVQGTVAKLEHKVHQMKETLDDLWAKIAGCAANAVEGFKEAGVSALDNAVAAMGVKRGLENLQEGLQSALSGIKEALGKAEEMGVQLRRGFRDIANAGRIAANKELDFDPKVEEGRFQSAVLAPMRATQRLLSGMNNATLATIGAVEDLEQSADMARERQEERAAEKPGKRLAKKPSIRQALQKNQAEIAAKSAPATDKEKKQEAAL